MPQKINLNAPPYNDDFDVEKEYYKVLFRPGFSIQSRELTSLQSILQNQIENLGRSRFKQGQQVVPGEVSFNNRLNYVKLASVSEVAVSSNGVVEFKKYDIANLVGFTLQGISSGVTATVLSYSYGNDLESDVLYVKYTNSGNSNNEFTFRQGETLEAIDILDTPTLVVGTDGSVLPTSIEVKDYDTGAVTTVDSPAMGYASGVQVEEGVYFINGYFVNNFKELIVVDKYYNKPSAKVGFKITESIVNANEDSSLFDNAQGFSNYTAPGADRLKIALSLIAKEYDSLNDDDYVQLVIIKNGEIQKLIKPNDYGIVEETLAKRTYDESGDYVVSTFPLDLREYYQKNSNRGLYGLDSETNLVNGLSETDANSTMVAGIGPGKAYIKGFEVANKEVKYLNVSKSRDTLKKDNNLVKASGLASFNLTNLYNTLPLNADGQQLTAYPTVFLNSVFNDGSIGSNDTESPTAQKQTIARRGQTFGLDDGIITLYLNNPANYGSRTFPTSTEFGNTLKELWFIVSLGVTGPTTVAGKVDLLSYSLVKKPQIDPTSPDLEYLEVTVKGNKRDIDFFLKEYDESDGVYRRKLFVSESDAKEYYFATSLTIFPYSEILDYNNHITPIIGICKPKDFSLVERGSGFNPDLDIVISKGRGTAVGGISEIKIVNGGSGYTTAPTVTITGGGGSGATATATITAGVVTSIALNNQGSGYTSGPTITFSGGSPTVSASAEAVFRSNYNSIFKFSYFNPVFFTRIVLDSPVAASTFEPGKYIVGSTSGSYGVVEGSSTSVYSSRNIIFVKTLSGKFVSGETIIDEAGNSKRIARDGTISHFKVLNRGLGYTSAGTIFKINGVEYTSSAVELGIVAQTIYKTVIKDKALVSQVYNTVPEVTVEHSSPVTTEAIIVPVLYRNSVYTYNPENVKSLHSEFGYGGSSKFTADVETLNANYSTNKILTDFTFSGRAGNNYVECNGFSGDPSNDVVQGDIVQFIDDENIPVRAIAQQSEKPEGLQKARLYLDRTLINNVTNSNVVCVRPKIDNATKSTLIIPTGAKFLEKVVVSTEDSRIRYHFRRDFVTTVSSSGGDVTFAAQLPFGTQQFAPFSENSFLLTVLDKRSSTTLETGDVIYIAEDQIDISTSVDSDSGLTAGSVTITLADSFFGTSTDFPILKLTATIESSKARPRLKSFYENKRILVVSPGDRVVPIRGTDFDSNSTDVLSYADAVKIRYIYEGTSSTPPVVSTSGELVTGIDVTNRFIFDDGQRDTFYDVSRLVLKPGAIPPTGQLIIAFDYFEHSNGDFCTVDSYLHEAGVELNQIPYFNSNVYGKISLRDVFDFRPKVDSFAVISGYQDTPILGQEDYNSFVRSAGVASSTPAVEDSLPFTVSFSTEQYLDRIDGIYVDKNGKFFVKQGNSSLNPTKPEDDSESLPLYYLYIPSYTDEANDVRIIPVDNKRYTMRDIGKLEKRVERLEQYTMLSILEQQALNMQIVDELGLDKIKSGFIVDNFENHSVGNLSSLDYLAAIDTQQSILRPRAIESSYRLEEVSATNQSRVLSNYVKNNDVITLPYKNIKAIENQFATKKINVNPFAVLQYVGEARLYPNCDQWFDYNEMPLILDNDGKVFSAFYAKNDAVQGFSSIYNNYVINWIGTNRVFYNVSSLNNIDRVVSTSTTYSARVASSSNASPQNNQLAKGVSTTSRGSKVVVNSLQTFCRSVPVFFKLTRMKPSTTFYAFIDGRSVDRWIAQDYRYTGIPGNSISIFNSGITTDKNGNASGLLLIPAGAPPVKGTDWTGNVDTVQYDETSEFLSLISGTKTVKFTTDENGLTSSDVESFTEINYYAAGGFPEQPASITSTIPAIFKGEEGTQTVSVGGSKKESKPNPLSQTFKVEGYPGGVFFTGLDLYFNTKSSIIPVKTYLSNVESGKPGKYILPGSETVLLPNTYLRVFTNGTLSVTKGENATGESSGASGPILEIFDRNGTVVNPSTTGVYTLDNSQVYTLVLENHNGSSFTQSERLSFLSLDAYNVSNSTDLSVTICRDSGRVTRLNITDVGSGYQDATLVIESPQLVGGTNATAVCSVSGGNIFDATIGVSGSGYTDPPSVIINGVGSSIGAASIQAIITIDTPAVRMGVAVDPRTSDVVDSTTPTRFNFEHPVYLQNDTEYALVVESDSSDYTLWASRLGQTEISTSTVVSSQPLLGSVFRSQNVDDWTEDLLEDIKFTLYRAQFDSLRPATVTLTNEPLSLEKLKLNPIETDALSDTNATSELFRNNNKIIQVSHPNNGFEDSGKSYTFFRNSSDVGGISSDIINSELFQIVDNGNDFYTLNAGLNAGSNDIGGRDSVLASYNRKFEKLYADMSTLNFSDTKIDAEVRTTDIIPIDYKNVNYSSYTHTTGFEKTFINQEHYFENQKVIASRINELKNPGILDRSLTYRFTLTTTNPNLSPVIDLRASSIKLINNQIEKSRGKENRFGKRDQILSFYPLYKFGIIGTNTGTIDIGDGANPRIVVGTSSQARGILVKLDTANSEIYVKMVTSVLFTPGERLEFTSQPGLIDIDVQSSGLTAIDLSFDVSTNVTAIDSTDLTKTYDNIISGKVIRWDSQRKVLQIGVSKNPINSNYTAPVQIGTDYSRVPFSSTSDTQDPDIFRVGDLVSYPGQPSDEKLFLQIKEIDYTNGVSFVGDIYNNSSSVAKYTTKEIAIENPANRVDVRLTINLFSEDDIAVLYKIKPVSSQFNFEDLGWQYFNGDGRPDIRVIPSSDNTIASYIENQDNYKEYKFSASNLVEFSSFAIKIVMKTSNPVFVPKIQDCRVVASY